VASGCHLTIHDPWRASNGKTAPGFYTGGGAVEPHLMGQRIRCIQCLKLLRRERQGECDGVLLYMRRQKRDKEWE
jgi:hypothetical protein